MTSSKHRATALALPLLLLPPLLLTACSSAAAGSAPSASAATASDTSASASAPRVATAAPSGVTTAAALCAAVPAADLAAAAKSAALTAKVPVGTGDIECNWASADLSTHFSALWADTGDNTFDLTKGALGNQHPATTTVAGHPAGTTASETEVDLGDHQLDVFTVHGATSAQLTAVAAVLAQKLG